ncbi:hypothetical protein ARMGADRAFT_184221 [Armillaria gallica]|uniref:Uncharacterized protein n=1 Tax=Armillaria gallica TaxID=47427 RepID=A0A2H3DAM0_ARMGA|nr:hypothetical protein ARMGADRAFT_184221 [Armillaria gallica]
MPTVPYTVTAVQLTAVSRMAKGPQRYGTGFDRIPYRTRAVYRIRVAFWRIATYLGFTPNFGLPAQYPYKYGRKNVIPKRRRYGYGPVYTVPISTVCTGTVGIPNKMSYFWCECRPS